MCSRICCSKQRIVRTSWSWATTTETDGARFFYAHTAPVHFEIDGPVRPRQREVNYFIQRMEQEIARVSAAKAGLRTRVVAFFGKIDMEMSELSGDEARHGLAAEAAAAEV